MDVRTLAIDSTGYIFAGTHRGGIFRSVQSTTAVESIKEEHLSYSLSQNYPNPFNPSTTIRYVLPSRSHVTLTVFSALGQKVVELVNGDIDAGYHSVEFNASNLASGLYFYRLQADSFVVVKKLLLVR